MSLVNLWGFWLSNAVLFCFPFKWSRDFKMLVTTTEKTQAKMWSKTIVSSGKIKVFTCFAKGAWITATGSRLIWMATATSGGAEITGSAKEDRYLMWRILGVGNDLTDAGWLYQGLSWMLPVSVGAFYFMNTLRFHFAFHKLLPSPPPALKTMLKWKGHSHVWSLFNASPCICCFSLISCERSSFCFKCSWISYFFITATQCKCRRLQRRV